VAPSDAPAAQPRKEEALTRSLAALLLSILLLALTVSPAAGDGASPARHGSCGTITAGGSRLHVSIAHGRVHCAKARHVFRLFFGGRGRHHVGRDLAHSYTSVGRWRCGTGAGGGGCIRYGRTYRTARDFIVALS
jgi:hypothetical protein